MSSAVAAFPPFSPYKFLINTVFVVTVFLFQASNSYAQKTLRSIKARNVINCGINMDLVGFSFQDKETQKWSGFEVDFCRALSAAIFDNPDQVNYIPLKANERFEFLKKNKIDLIVFQTTYTISRENNREFLFPAVTYFDGQAFLTRKEHGFSSIKELDKATICLTEGTQDEFNLNAHFSNNSLEFTVKSYHSIVEAFKAYEHRECNALTAKSSSLYAIRSMALAPDEHYVLPEIISKEPISPVVLATDLQWAQIVRWTHQAMLNAEEFGVSQSTVKAMQNSKNPSIRRLLGLEEDYGKPLGLTRDWVIRIVSHVGNYGDVFERNLGDSTLLKIKRGLNDLWIRGGLQYGLPIR